MDSLIERLDAWMTALIFAIKANFSGTISFVVLVTLVIFVTLDLNQPARGFIRVNQQSLERLIPSMAK